MSKNSSQNATYGRYPTKTCARRVCNHAQSRQREDATTLRDVAAHRRTRRSQAAYFAEAQRLSATGSFSWNALIGEIFWSEKPAESLVTIPQLRLLSKRVQGALSRQASGGRASRMARRPKLLEITFRRELLSQQGGPRADAGLLRKFNCLLSDHVALTGRA